MSNLKVVGGVADFDVAVGAKRYSVGITHGGRKGYGNWWRWESRDADPKRTHYSWNTAKTWAVAYRSALRACDKMARSK